MAFLLYLLTAIMTALPVLHILGWAPVPSVSVWNVSLLGSCLLVVAGLVSFSNRRVAARIAVVAVVAIWSFYLPAVEPILHARLTDQSLTVQVVLWTPSKEALTFSDTLQATNAGLTTSDMEHLQALKLTGKIENAGRQTFGTGRASHALIVLDHPVMSRAELPEPNGVDVIYIQRQNGWEKYPATAAPTLKRTISLEPLHSQGLPTQTLVMVELATGAKQGFGVLWPESEAPR